MDYKKKNSSVSVILLFLFSEILHLSCFYVCDVLNKCVSGVEFFLSISIIFFIYNVINCDVVSNHRYCLLRV